MPAARKRKPTVSEAGPHPIDVHVGKRLRILRITQDRSQTYMASGVGLSFQQFQKYEKGSNRISASKLWEIARMLNVPVSYFFDEIDGAGGTGVEAPDPGEALKRRDVLQLLRWYYKIEDPKVRQAFFLMCKAVARQHGDVEQPYDERVFADAAED